MPAIDWDAECFAAVHAAFAEPDAVTYQPQGGDAFEITDAIFNDGYRGIALTDDGPEAATIQPSLDLRLAVFPAGTRPRQNDRVTVPRTGLTYIVSEVRPDLLGLVKLMLQKTTA